MAAAVLSSKLNLSIPNPFHMASHQPPIDISTTRTAASSSRLQPSASQLPPPPVPDSHPKTFKRLRTSLEHSIRTATKSKSRPGTANTAVEEDGTISQSRLKGKEKASQELAQPAPQPKDKPRSRMLSKVSFRRTGRDSLSPSPAPPPVPTVLNEAIRVERDRDKDQTHQAGYTSFLTPSLRQASMSSPALHLASQAFPSPYSQPFALPASSSSNLAALVTPPARDRTRRTNGQLSANRDISGPLPLSSKREVRPNGGASTSSTPSPQNKSSTPRPSPITVVPNQTIRASDRTTNSSPAIPETPRRQRDQTRTPDLSPPSPSPRAGYLASKRAGGSSTHLPLASQRPSSPTTPTQLQRAASPTRARSSSRTPTSSRAVPPSSSSSHLPLTPTTPTPATRRPSVDSIRRPSVDYARRTSVDTARRPSVDVRRPSVETRRPSIDTQRPSTSPISSRAASPTTTPIRARAISPSQRNYSPSQLLPRNHNASSTSLHMTSNPEQRDLIRSASSILVKELLKPPSQVRESTLDQKEYEEVELRLRSLARLERVWGKSGSGMGSATQLNTLGNSSSSLSAGAEERERRYFCEALRDGYVLCQLVNKLYPSTIARIDKREDGFVRTSNVTKFLAASSALGVPPDDLFMRDDLIEATPDCLARVAKNIVSLHQVYESPVVDKSRYMQGGGQVQRTPSSPYNHGAASRAAASTPNLSSAQRPTSPISIPSPPGRKRLSPPQPSLPPVRSDSPNESEGSSGTRKASNPASVNVFGDDFDDVPPVPPPPPRSPLRPRPSMDRTSMADSTRVNVGDSVRGSMADSYAPSLATTRQSLAVSTVTDTTTYSSLLADRQRNNSSAQNSKFGTIRTFTTEATSLAPSEGVSSFRAEASCSSVPPSPAEELSARKRKPSETAIADLTRVVEETDESGSSANGRSKSSKGKGEKGEKVEKERAKPSPIKLGKGKWPDDFIDAFQGHLGSSSALEDEEELLVSQTPLSIPPSRKLAVVGAAARANESVDSLPQFRARRPSHRARHSVDTPGLLPKDPLRRDASPDGSVSPTPRVMLRRNSTRTGPHRNGVYIPRNSDEPKSSDDDLVPFPRTVSGEHSSTPPSSGAPSIQFPGSSTTALDGSNPSKTAAASGQSSSASNERPRQIRGRFQSEFEGSSRRKPRPNSYDEMGAKPRRTRFESMVNLGVGSSNASASDLLQRDSYEGNARQTLVVREDGKPPTQFQLGNCIGRGQFGAVYRALNLNTGQMVAVKRIRLEGLKEEEIAQLMKEVDLLKSLSHPSIVKYEGMARDEDTLNIVLEYAENGSLGQTLKAFGQLNERLVANYVVKILEGLHYLHRSDVVHCDLKAANILTTKTGNVKLSDFGVSLNLRAMEREMKDVAGTPNWMAPEVIELKGASTKSDIWSLACTVIELLTGRPPYGDIANSMSVMFRIVEDKMPPLPEGCSDLLRDFLTQCFNKDPSKRPDAETLCEHEWLKQNWPPHKDLRAQDSIPFLRRVSADLQKSEAIRYLAQIEMPDTPERSTPEHRPRLEELISGSPPKKRPSIDAISMSPREHSFVKTTFARPMICRICLESVKKSAVLCEHCSLVAHAKCIPKAPPICDLRAQLLLYAHYAENGTPTSAADILTAAQSVVPVPSSPVSDGGGLSPRPSLDASPSSPHPPSTPNGHPPTAFKVLAAFKRSRSSLNTNESEAPSTSPNIVSAPQPRQVSHRPSFLRRKPTHKERPPSIASGSASPNSSSMRSAVTATESLSSQPDTVRQSMMSMNGTEGSISERQDPRLSKMVSFSARSIAETEHHSSPMATIPGGLPPDSSTHRRRKDTKSDKNGCVLQ